ncbi:transposase [Paramecium bursaria Chlorella virus AN69C]|uniref:Transposase n=1 Tax=Paramecium bursaria Chlorella virus NYs1 TaxID=83442 RepID=M1I979_9PHYC|nr:transposase [Paramecium bursaria Chlorella virus NYs1]AGE48574.1 transposase [Paramecium bursaria Chlorella virus AN69C]AGE58463.1 transposase [Paramecium bursaria Chlorella virus NY2B]AGE58846.1 transposase [Paramecium bursaria Chlorella virus NYs1]
MSKLKPWWSEKCQQITKIIPLNPENISFQQTKTNMFQNDVGVKKVFRTRKVKLNPTKQQKMMLMKFANDARYSYNAALSAVNDKTHKANKIELQNAFLSLKRRDGTFNQFFQKRRWLLSTPQPIRQQAIFEVAKNFKVAFSNLKNKNIDHFKMKYKSKKNQRQYGFSLGIGTHLKHKDGVLTIFPRSLGQMRYFGSLPFEGVPDAECRIQRDPYGDHWLLVPVYKTTKTQTIKPIVAIDPGVRTPFACFKSNGESKTLGEDMNVKLTDIRTRVSLIDRRISKCQDVTLKRKMSEHRRRLFRKHQRVRDAFHWDIINDITNECSGVLLPPFETQRVSRMLKNKTNCSMFGVSHYTFRMRIKGKCEEKGLLYVEPTEEYTSKTCGVCGRINYLLGSKKTFECFCGNVCDRDVHAARNILLKWLSTEAGARVVETFLASRSR